MVSKLTPEQAAFYFLSGYTTKLSDPKNLEATFSPCYGESSLPLSPAVYTKLFYEKIKNHNTKVWLINSGWTKGKTGLDRVISFKEIETIIDSIVAGKLDKTDTQIIPTFNLAVPKYINGVSSELLFPDWGSKIELDEETASLAIKFNENFEAKWKGKLGNYESDIASALPKVV